MGRVLRRLVVSACVLPAIAAVGCGGSAQGDGDRAADEGDDPYRVGYVVFLSGPAAVYADAGVQGMTVARDAANRDNIAGSPVEVVVADDASDPATSARVCNRLVTKDRVDAIVGYQTSAAEVACLPITTRAGIPYIHAANNPGDVCAPNYFTSGEVPNQQVAPMLERFLKQGKRRFYLIGSDYNYPRGVNRFARRYIESHGGKVVGEVYAPLDVSDVSPYVSRVTAARPDVVLELVVGAGKPAFIRGVRSASSGRKVTISSISMEEATQKAVGPASEGVLSSFSYFADVSNPLNEEFKRALQKRFGAKAETPGIGSIWSHDAILALAHAVKKAGTADGQAVTAALKKLTFESPRGKISFTQSGSPRLPWRLGEAQGDGTFETIASGPPIEPVTECR